MNILVTGFVPFQNHTVNPSYEVVSLLPKTIKNHRIIPLILPVEYDHCFDQIDSAIQEQTIDAIVMLGLAGDRTKINLERVAINVKSSTYSDNADVRYLDDVVVPNGDNAYFSTLPLRNIEQRLQQKNIPVSISNTAGTYVCNTAMYTALHYTTDIPVGFIHLPPTKSISITDQLEAVIETIRTIIEMEETDEG